MAFLEVKIYQNVGHDPLVVTSPCVVSHELGPPTCPWAHLAPNWSHSRRRVLVQQRCRPQSLTWKSWRPQVFLGERGKMVGFSFWGLQRPTECVADPMQPEEVSGASPRTTRSMWTKWVMSQKTLETTAVAVLGGLSRHRGKQNRMDGIMKENYGPSQYREWETEERNQRHKKLY